MLHCIDRRGLQISDEDLKGCVTLTYYNWWNQYIKEWRIWLLKATV